MVYNIQHHYKTMLTLLTHRVSSNTILKTKIYKAFRELLRDALAARALVKNKCNRTDSKNGVWGKVPLKNGGRNGKRKNAHARS